MVMSSINEISNNFNVLNSDSNYLINSVAENEDFEMNQLNLSALFGPSFRPIEMNQPSFTSSCNLPGFYEDYNFNSNSNGFNSNHNSFNSSSNSFNINGNSCCSETSPHPPHNLSGCYFSTNCFNPNNVAIAFQNSHQNFIPNFAYTAADYPFIPRRLRFSEYYFRNRNGPLQENCPTLLNALGYTNSAGNQSAHFQLQANTGENTNYGFSSSTPFQIKQENFENYSHQDGTISSSTVSGVRVEPQHASNYVEVPNKAGKRLRKNSRTPFTPEQIQRLEQEFERDSFSTNYEGVAGEINITPKQVQVWFQNKRSKLKRFKGQQGRKYVFQRGKGHTRTSSEFRMSTENEDHRTNSPRTCLTPLMKLSKLSKVNKPKVMPIGAGTVSCKPVFTRPLFTSLFAKAFFFF